jgi:branched-subunit amino acid ABC-type transport system permease component
VNSIWGRGDEMSETITSKNWYLKLIEFREIYPIFVYSLITFVITLLLGIILYLLGTIGPAAILLDIAFISFVFTFLGYTSTDHFNNIMNPVISKLQDYYARSKVLTIIGIFLAVMILAAILSILTQINLVSHSILAIFVASDLIFVSVGLTMSIRVRKFANFAHAEFAMVGIYTGITLNEILGSGGNEWYDLIFFQVIIAFFGAGIVGVLSELLVFRPLTRRNATPLSLMVASIGLGLILRQSIQEVHGSIPRTYPPKFPDFFDSLADIPVLGVLFADQTRWDLPGNLPVTIPRADLWGLIFMILTIFGLQYIFKNTTMGIAMRATADDPDLAEITGINTSRVIYFTWFVSAGVTGMGALFLFKSSQIQPGSGFVQLLLIFAVVILGGFDSFEGTVISGFILSYSMTAAVVFNNRMHIAQKNSELLDHMVFWSTSGDWKLVVGFVIIIVVLIFRPRGIFGLVDPQSKL